MANTKKAPVEKVETIVAADVTAAETAAAAPKAEKAPKKAAAPKAAKAEAKKPAAPKAEKAAKAPAKASKTAAAKETAPKAAAKTAEKKAPAKRGPKVKEITLGDVVAVVRTKANAANTTKVTKKIACTVNLNGNVQGDFYIMLDAGDVIAVEPYKYEDADISLWGTAEDMIAVMTNKLKLIDAISTGKIGLWGNAEKAVIFVDAIF